jgi:hypothetical protein
LERKLVPPKTIPEGDLWDSVTSHIFSDRNETLRGQIRAALIATAVIDESENFGLSSRLAFSHRDRTPAHPFGHFVLTLVRHFHLRPVGSPMISFQQPSIWRRNTSIAL